MNIKSGRSDAKPRGALNSFLPSKTSTHQPSFSNPEVQRPLISPTWKNFTKHQSSTVDPIASNTAEMPSIQKKRATIVTRASAKREAARLTPKPLTAFELFPRLPTEIRLKIFQIATTDCDDRIVQVKVKNLVTRYSEHGRGVVFSSTTPIPGVLHACSESREIALHRYQLAMTSFASGPRIFLDYLSDTVYFGASKSPRRDLVFSIMSF